MQARTTVLMHANDDLVVALTNLKAGTSVGLNGHKIELRNDVPGKHKFVRRDVAAGELLHMYGVVVGKALRDLKAGELVSQDNLGHATGQYAPRKTRYEWQAPDVSQFKDTTFAGYVRKDGKVGTANYWIVVPLVFCENRNTIALRDAFLDELGYRPPSRYAALVRELAAIQRRGGNRQELLAARLQDQDIRAAERLFPYVDGVKFLPHTEGCGTTHDDAREFSGLLAGYITHPNVAGATILSLGCQHAQLPLLESEIHKRDPHFQKPLYFFEQQKIGSESMLMEKAIHETFLGLVEANKARREPAPLSALSIGVECGGSDGFSGISANPAMGYCCDLLVALGGTAILSEFPELCGVEQSLCDRCVDESVAKRFAEIMKAYETRVRAAGSSFAENPSPGNIRDGLITDAIKSAGAARKGGTSPITQALDYPEWSTTKGLNLLNTPGNDVESVTALVGAGSNMVLFSTGLGTPTGNPVVPVIKIGTNTPISQHMKDAIDVDAGTIITGQDTIETLGSRLLELSIRAASGEYVPRAVALGQDDFIPWRRGFSL